MTLFEHSAADQKQKLAPLAARMRPKRFADYVGQSHIVGPDSALRRSLHDGHIPSMIIWGPPGTGKTTLAILLAAETSSHFERISAVASGVSDLRRVMSEAGDRLGMNGQRTILFVDEIHRFNKAQQDVILPYVEDGTIVLIGATTENPSFEVVSPLLSRTTVYDLKPLTPGEIRQIIGMALRDSASGLGNLDLKLDDSGIESIVKLSNGDARNALNTLELSAHAARPDAYGTRLVDAEVVESAAQRRIARYDKDGDLHFDTISAFIKSVRSSDPDAAIYWLARMIEGGEDPMFIARRLVILASEDIGMADPNALTVAVSAQQAAHFVGMPEGRIVLAEATVYLASAPKSNTAYTAISAALEDARNTRNDPVPLHLRNAVTGLMKDMGYGEDYKYAHDYDGNFTPMQNLPDNLNRRQYYKPGDQGYEIEVSKRLANWWGDEDSDDQDSG